MPKDRKPHLSASQLFKLSECGEMYRLHYKEKIRGPRPVRMLIGLAVHQAVAADLQHKVLNDGELMNAQDLHDAARDMLVKIWNAGDVDLPEGANVETEHAEALDAVQGYVSLHHLEVAPNIEPEAVEAEAMIEIKDFPYDIALVKDIVETDGTIRDTKTTQKSPNKAAAQTSMQLQLYALHSTLKYGVEPPKLVLDYLVRTPKTKTCKYVLLEAKPIAARQNQVVAMIKRAATVIEAGAYMPNPHSWLCSKSACTFARMGVCDFWSGRE